MSFRPFWMLSLMSVVMTCQTAPAAELKIVSAGAVQEVLEAFAARYSQSSGHQIALAFATVGVTATKVRSGEPADIVIVSTAAMADLAKAGSLAGASTPLGRVGMGLAVRDGAAVPDVTTLDAFKAALLQAKSIAYTDPAAGGSAGTYFAGLLGRLGIADAVNNKAVKRAGGRDVAKAVAEGAAEIGITFISEIAPVKGVHVGAPLPAGAQFHNSYSAGVLAASAHADAARGLIAALTDPLMLERWSAAGFEPALDH
jgi:molybdate transport system substrate-binding protein